jgi:glycosyltransferase involved in cell wall biosynthesis
MSVSKNERVTVLFPITDLAMDGAQRQLLELVKGIDRARFRPVVLTIRSGGSQGEEFRNVPDLAVLSLNQRWRFDFLGLLKMGRLLRRLKVDVVQPFLTPATLFGLLPALVLGTPVKIVTERCGPGRTRTSLGFRLYLRAEDFLSRFADCAVPNSELGKDFLVERGLNPGKVRVIYNGLNLARLVPSAERVAAIKEELRVPEGGRVVGMLARLFPQKRHDVFLRAAAIVWAEIPETRFAVVGGGPKSDLRVSQGNSVWTPRWCSLASRRMSAITWLPSI